MQSSRPTKNSEPFTPESSKFEAKGSQSLEELTLETKPGNPDEDKEGENETKSIDGPPPFGRDSSTVGPSTLNTPIGKVTTEVYTVIKSAGYSANATFGYFLSLGIPILTACSIALSSLALIIASSALGAGSLIFGAAALYYFRKTNKAEEANYAKLIEADTNESKKSGTKQERLKNRKGEIFENLLIMQYLLDSKADSSEKETVLQAQRQYLKLVTEKASNVYILESEEAANAKSGLKNNDYVFFKGNDGWKLRYNEVKDGKISTNEIKLEERVLADMATGLSPWPPSPVALKEATNKIQLLHADTIKKYIESEYAIIFKEKSELLQNNPLKTIGDYVRQKMKPQSKSPIGSSISINEPASSPTTVDIKPHLFSTSAAFFGTTGTLIGLKSSVTAVAALFGVSTAIPIFGWAILAVGILIIGVAIAYTVHQTSKKNAVRKAELDARVKYNASFEDSLQGLKAENTAINQKLVINIKDRQLGSQGNGEETSRLKLELNASREETNRLQQQVAVLQAAKMPPETKDASLDKDKQIEQLNQKIASQALQIEKLERGEHKVEKRPANIVTTSVILSQPLSAHLVESPLPIEVSSPALPSFAQEDDKVLQRSTSAPNPASPRLFSSSPKVTKTLEPTTSTEKIARPTSSSNSLGSNSS